MLFNSVEYIIFLLVVFISYWFIFRRNLKLQNFLILVCSYVFYAWWDWRFLSLIIFSSFVDYCCGIMIHKKGTLTEGKKWLILSLLVNLSFLGVFKYFNFFSESLASALWTLGYEVNTLTLDVILPVGISFYTFQTMSYTIDVYKKRLEPTRDIIAFFAFVSFFPQLVAGPIERASNLLPQFLKKRSFSNDKASDGLRQILWGLFKKVVVADNCALIVNEIFSNYSEYNASSLLLGTLFFAFQIYGDFSGYSDIAIGTARLFGFNLMQNFAFPYFSRDIAEFWRRWHISLSTWFRDYVYIPLGGSRRGVLGKIRNTFIIFIVSGLWHGANWTFIVWGGLNALYFLPLLLLKKNRVNTNNIAENKTFINMKELIQVLTTFFLTLIAWVFFRSVDIVSAVAYLKGLFNISILEFPTINLKPLLFIFLLITVEWINRQNSHGLFLFNIKQRVFRWGIYMFLIILIFWFGAPKQEFIYFQF